MIILNGVNEIAPLNLSVLPFKEDNISTRIALGVLNHQFLKRPCKEHF